MLSKNDALVKELVDMGEENSSACPSQEQILETAMNMAGFMLKETKGRQAIPITKAFLCRATDNDPLPPMAQMLKKSGRGGGLPLLLYIALTWRSVAKPFNTHKPAEAWARLLALPDPQGRGANRIRRALHVLEDVRLIRRESKGKGVSPVITLLNPDGSGSAYVLPWQQYRDSKVPYFKVPASLWTQGIIQQLKSPGLVMLLILLAESSDRRNGYIFPGDVFAQRYAVSASTRTRGTKILLSTSVRGRFMNLLTTERESVRSPENSKFDMIRSRKRYRLHLPIND